MKNKKGFTLIELLAVIVVLAIIALIATPIVMNTIKKVKVEATKRSIENYSKQVETAIATSKLDNKEVADGTYNINNDGNICLNDNCTDKLTIEMNGERPKEGKISVENGTLVSFRNLLIGNKYYKKGTNGIDVSDEYETICKATNSDNVTVGSEPQGNYDIGDEYICEVAPGKEYTFFISSLIKDETNSEVKNVNLVMNANITENGEANLTSSGLGYEVTWISKEDYIAAGGTNEEWEDYIGSGGIYDSKEFTEQKFYVGNNRKGPITALNALNNATKSWYNIDNYNEEYVEENGVYTLQLTGKARLLTKTELKNFEIPIDRVEDSGQENYEGIGLIPILYTNLVSDAGRFYWIMGGSYYDLDSTYFLYKGNGGKLAIQKEYLVTSCGLRPVIKVPVKELG